MTKFNSDVVLNDMFLSLYLLWIVEVYYSRFLKVVTNLLSGSAVVKSIHTYLMVKYYSN